MRLMAQHGLQVVPYGHGAFQHRFASQALGHVPLGHFKHCLQLGKLRRPQAQLLVEQRLAGLQQWAQATELRQQMADQSESWLVLSLILFEDHQRGELP